MPHKSLPAPIFIAGFSLVLGIAAMPAAAEVITHWYFGANFLNAETDIGDISSVTTFNDGSTEEINAAAEDTEGNGWKLFAGYQFSRYLAVEAGYVDLGKYNMSGTDNFTNALLDLDDSGGEVRRNVDGTIDLDLHPKGFEAAGVAISPRFYGFTLRARAGILISDYDVKIKSVFNIPSFDNLDGETVPAFTITRPEERQSTEIELLTGIGLDYRVSNDWSLGLHWNRYFDVGNDEFQEEDIDVFGVDLSYHY